MYYTNSRRSNDQFVHIFKIYFLYLYFHLRSLKQLVVYCYYF